MQPTLFERSFDLNYYSKYNRTSKYLIISKIKLISQKQNILNRIKKNLNWEDYVITSDKYLRPN